MIFISVKDDIEQRNIIKIIKEVGIKEKIVTVKKTPKLSKKDLKSINIIITDYNENFIKKLQKYNKEIVVYLGKRSSKIYKENEILYNKKTNTYFLKNELREILTFYIKKKNIKKFILIFLLVIFLVSVLILFLFKINQLELKVEEKEPLVETKKEEKLKKPNMQLKYENIVFLGDSLTNLYNLTKHFPDIPVINSGTCGFVTDDILKNLGNYVYIYNPTKVFILIGTNDISLTDNTNEEILANIKKIVNEIQKYRPKAHIYVESLYPINNNNEKYEKIDMDKVKDRDNLRIKEINKLIYEYCQENKLEYINMYDELVDDNNNLNIEYTTDGLHMTEAGYDVITKKIMLYIKD